MKFDVIFDEKNSPSILAATNHNRIQVRLNQYSFESMTQSEEMVFQSVEAKCV